MTNGTNLFSLLGADEAEALFLAYQQKQMFHGAAADRTRFECILPWQEINRFIEGPGIDTGRLKIIRDGQVVPAGWYTAGGSGGRLRVGPLLQMLQSGLSIGWDHVTNDIPFVADLSAGLERRLRARVWVNAYLSFRKGGAFRVHYDAHDVLVLQLHGSKRWTTYGMPIASPVKPYTAPSRRPDPQWTTDVHAGDVLFLPRGEVHSAEVIGEHSVHLTIGIQRVRGLDYLGWLVQQCEAEEVLRMDVPDERDAARFAAYESRVKQAIAAALQASDLRQFVAADDGERRLQPSLRLQDPFAETSEDVVVVPLVLRPVPSSVTESVGSVRAGGQDLRLSPLASRLLKAITEEGPTRLEELAARFAATSEDAHLALKSLLESGLAAVRDH